MKRLIASVTERGQVTLPAEVRRLLGAKPRSKVVFEIDGGEVRVIAAPMTLEEAFGSIPPLGRAEDFKEIERAAKDEYVRRFFQKFHNS